MDEIKLREYAKRMTETAIELGLNEMEFCQAVEVMRESCRQLFPEHFEVIDAYKFERGLRVVQ